VDEPTQQQNLSPVESARRIVAACAGTDAYPDDHAVRVAECAGQIADQLRVNPATRRIVVEGALLHDVGKLRVDAAIVAKPGPLSPEERRQMDMHPIEGANLLQDVAEPEVVEVVHGHHERWDGSGYPRGLRAGEISLAARVVAVADVFLAMLEPRPYRAALSTQEAYDELRRAAGSHLDPTCVAALFAIRGSEQAFGESTAAGLEPN
jgi:putative two-component system response regulator